MSFCWCTVNVSDMDKSLEFYQGIVGLSLSRRLQASPGVEIAFLGDGETKLELICSGKGKPNIGEDISIGFTVNSAEEMMNFIMQKGLKVHSGPFEPNPHTRFFYVQDPDGLKVQFVENK